jgi:hypothetical protein
MRPRGRLGGRGGHHQVTHRTFGRLPALVPCPCRQWRRPERLSCRCTHALKALTVPRHRDQLTVSPNVTHHRRHGRRTKQGGLDRNGRGRLTPQQHAQAHRIVRIARINAAPPGPSSRSRCHPPADRHRPLQLCATHEDRPLRRFPAPIQSPRRLRTRSGRRPR